MHHHNGDGTGPREAIQRPTDRRRYPDDGRDYRHRGGGTLGEHARRAFASYPDIDYQIATAIRAGQILIAHSPADIVMGYLPIGACAAALLRLLRDGTLSPALTNLRKVVGAISWRGRSSGRGLDILRAIGGIQSSWAEAAAARQMD